MAFSYYRTLTIDHTKCGNANSSSFPVLVSISDITFKDAAHSGNVANNTTGYDIIFTSDSAGTTKIPWEVEFYDGVNGILIAWVNIATVSNTSDTVFYIFYGDGGITTAQNTGSYAPTAVWDSHYKGVWHLPNGTTLTANDSTSNARNFTLVGSPTAVAGEIDGGANFDGITQYATNTDDFALSGDEVTISMWLKDTSAGFCGSPIVKGITNNSGLHDWGILFNNIYKNIYLVRNGSNNSSSSGTVSSSVLTYVVGVMSSTASRVYFNGSGETAQGGIGTGNTTNTSGRTLQLMNSSVLSGGVLDEVRVSDIIRSADWILTEYNNQNAPGNIGSAGFITFGAETSPSTVVTENFSDTNTLSDSLSITLGLRCVISDTQSLSDGLSTSLELRCALSDTFSISDSIGILQTLNIPLSDTLNLNDTLGSSLTYLLALSDTTSLSDSILITNPSFSVLSVSVSDTLSLSFSLSDTLSIGIPLVSDLPIFSDILSLSDAIFLFSSASESISDTISLSDTFSILNSLKIPSSDFLSLSDVISSLNTYSNQPSDTLSLLDSVSISQPLPALLSDTLTISDPLSISLAAVLGVSDTLQLSDSLIVFRPVSSLLAETLIFSDSLSQLLTYATAFSDVIALSDATIIRAIVPSRVPIWHLQQSMSGVLSGR